MRSGWPPCWLSCVSDLGVIEGVTLLLDPGMTALTGETGAGKTMLVGAIGLLAGDRADPAVVRPGADEATVQGRFVWARTSSCSLESCLATADPRLPGWPAITAGELSELAAALVDLHGQHAQVGLLATASQRRALDRFAGVDLHDLEAARAALRASEAALEALGGDPCARERERDSCASSSRRSTRWVSRILARTSASRGKSPCSPMPTPTGWPRLPPRRR